MGLTGRTRAERNFHEQNI